MFVSLPKNCKNAASFTAKITYQRVLYICERKLTQYVATYPRLYLRSAGF